MSSQNVLAQCDRVLGYLVRAVTAIAMFTLAPMMCLVAIDVVGRYLFNSPLPGVFEINSYFLMVLVIFFPLAEVQRRKDHVFVNIFTDRLGTRACLALDTVSMLMGFAIYALIGFYNLKQALLATRVGEYIPGVIDIPVWISKWIIPIGCLVFCLQLLLDCVKNTRQLFAETAETTETREDKVSWEVGKSA